MIKGISPLIATIILIGLVVILSASFIIWGSKFTDILTKKTEKSSAKTLGCYSDIDLEVLSICYKENVNVNQGTTLDILRFKIKNNKDVDLGNQAFKVHIGGLGGSVDPLIVPQSFEALDIKVIEAGYDKDYNSENINKVIIIPRLLIGGEYVNCDPLNTEGINIIPC